MDAIVDYIQKGGSFIFPILAGSVWAMALMIERALFFWQAASHTSLLTNKFFFALENQGFSEAENYLGNKKGVLKRVLMTALKNRNLPLDQVESRVETVMLKELPILNKFLNTIATLGSLMPILGLLGTVTGMIATFQVIALKGTGDAQAMAHGISEALITTQAGLVAALPILLGHNLLNNRLNSIAAEVRGSTARVLEFIQKKNAR